MTARVLVVDDVVANVKLLEARLSAEYFEVATATNGPDGIAICRSGGIDVVLLDVMMPGMDGFEVCATLKADPRTQHVPVIMVTALDQPADRVRGLEAGADDFLTKPVNDIALITRVKSQARVKTLMDELRMRAETGEGMGLTASIDGLARAPVVDGRVLIVDDRESSHSRLVGALDTEHSVEVEGDPQQAIFKAAEGEYELAIVSLSITGFDALRLCSQLRSLERTRNLPIMIVVEPEDNGRLLRAFDIGVNDYIVRPVDKNELIARVRTQLRRRRYAEQLRDSFHQSVELAVTDGLTSLHNRRYMESHLATLVNQAISTGKDLSLLIIDIDYFKPVNDTYGHDAGDEVLREFAARLRANVRGIDLACRYGGEEFVVVMPDTDLSLAMRVGERLRKMIASDSFPIQGGAKLLPVTISIGVAALEGTSDTPDALLKRADQALYCAKRDGRNRVVSDAA